MKKAYGSEEYEIPDAHPAANCLPWNLDGPDFADLIESVKSGYDKEKPVLLQASSELIISGRRRALACVIAGVDFETREVDWTDEQVNEYVRRDELIRRNLTETQRSASLTDLAELNEHGVNQHENKGIEEVQRCTSSPKKLQQIADESGASLRTVKSVARVKKTAPELMEPIKEGKLDAHTAERAAKELSPKQVKRIAKSDDPKAEAKKLLPAKPKKTDKPAEPPAEKLSPTRGGNNFDFGANAPPESKPDAIEPAKPVKIIPPPVVDGWGIPVQPHAEDAFAAVPLFRNLISSLSQCQKLFNQLANLPGGKFLTLPDVSSYRRGAKDADGNYADRFVHNGLEKCIAQVKAAIPTYTVCPYQYAEAAHPEDCGCCKNLNWCPELGDSIPTNAIARAKAAFNVQESA